MPYRSSAKDLTAAWTALNTRRPPYVLPGDEGIKQRGRVSSFAELSASENLLRPGPRFQLSLLPVPYTGNIYTASVYILMLNPGFSPLDLFAEETSMKYRQALVESMNGKRPNYSFEPALGWTGGFAYWTSKLWGIIETVQRERGGSLQDALAVMAKKVAVLQLVPYHSAEFRLSPKAVARLRSVQLIRQFVQGYLYERVCRGECQVIVARQIREWGLPEHPDIVQFSSSEARGAHFTAKKRAGQALLKGLDVR